MAVYILLAKIGMEACSGIPTVREVRFAIGAAPVAHMPVPPLDSRAGSASQVRFGERPQFGAGRRFNLFVIQAVTVLSVH
jgi:hypothetical protein